MSLLLWPLAGKSCRSVLLHTSRWAQIPLLPRVAPECRWSYFALYFGLARRLARISLTNRLDSPFAGSTYEAVNGGKKKNLTENSQFAERALRACSTNRSSLPSQHRERAYVVRRSMRSWIGLASLALGSMPRRSLRRRFHPAHFPGVIVSDASRLFIPFSPH